MIQLLTDIVLILTGFQLILLSIVLSSYKKGNKLNRNLLIAFLLAKAFLILRWFSYRFSILNYQDFPFLYHLTAAPFFLLAPLLYFYIKSLCYKDFKMKGSNFVHFILFFIIIIYKVISIYGFSPESIDESSIFYQICIIHHNRVFWTLNLVQILLYIIAMLATLHGYRTKLTNLYSSVERINLNWLVSLLLVISLHWLFVTGRATFSFLNSQAVTFVRILDLFSITIFLVFTTILVVKGLHQLKIFTGIEEKPKYASSRLSVSDLQTYITRLNHYMQTHKPYLEPELTINDLSEKLSVPPWHLSRIINESFHQNFFNYVNSFRIEEVKQQMMNPKNHKKTILELLYEAGFNSKSTFNSAFKKYTGMTPGEFKRKSRRHYSMKMRLEQG